MVVLLLLIYCLCTSHCLWRFYVWSLFWYALLYVLSSFEIILTRKRAGCFAFIVLWVSCYCKSPLALPHSAFGQFVIVIFPDRTDFFIHNTGSTELLLNVPFSFLT